MARPEAVLVEPPKRSEKNLPLGVECGLGPIAHMQTLTMHRSSDPTPVRVGFITPSLLLGGAERWMIALARSSDPRCVRWTGTALTEWAQSDSSLSGELRHSMPIYGGPPRGEGEHDMESVDRLPTAQQGVDLVFQRSEVVVAWGLDHLADLVDGYRGRVVLVSHSAAEWTSRAIRLSEPGATDFAAVSEAALAPFSEAVRPRARVLYNGAEVSRCVPTRDRGDIRSSWGFDRRHRLIGYVGRYSPEKNPLAAAITAGRLGGWYRAVYMGGGWNEAETRSAAESAARGRVRFIPPTPSVGATLTALDLLMLASPNEGFSMVLIEAWLAGLPTVATRVGAVPELEAVHGRLVVPIATEANADELAEAVEAALSPSNREVVEHARSVAWNHLTSEAMATRWADYLREISGS